MPIVKCPICNQSREVKWVTTEICRSCAKKQSTPIIADRQCAFCGKTFTPNSSHQIYCKGPHVRQCPECGADYVEDNVENLKRPPVACSYKCRASAARKTSLNLYNCAAPGNTAEARKKAKQTCLKNYGVPYAMQSEDVKARARNSMMKLYRVDNISKIPEIVQARTQKQQDNNGGIMPFNMPECYDKQHQTMMNRYNVPYGTLTPNASHNTVRVSKINLKYKSYLEQIHCSVETEKSIHTRAYDLYLPEHDVVIEIDPTYTHSTAGTHWCLQGLDKYYHRDKTKLATDNGYRCIHIFDWDNPYIILNQFKSKQCIDADECELYKLTNQAADEFLTNFYYSGTHRGQMLCLGLVYQGQLCQIMTFGKPTHSKNHVAQIYRMATHPEFEIVDGYNKLSSFAADLGVYSIIKYVDLAKETGAECEAIGMRYVRTTPPRRIWSKNTKYINDSLVTSGKCNGRTENDLLNDGWRPVFDCGQAVYEFV